MISPLGPRDRRVLAIGLIACTALVGGARGLPAVLRWTRETRATAVQRGVAAAQADRSVVTATTTRDSLAAQYARYLALAPRLLEGETTAGAGGSLASLVTGAAATSNVRLGSVQIRADTTKTGAFTPVSVRVDLTSDIQGLSTLLATLERGQVFLSVRELSISQPEPSAGDDRVEALRAELVVEGLMLNRTRGPHR